MHKRCCILYNNYITIQSFKKMNLIEHFIKSYNEVIQALSVNNNLRRENFADNIAVIISITAIVSLGYGCQRYHFRFINFISNPYAYDTDICIVNLNFKKMLI